MNKQVLDKLFEPVVAEIAEYFGESVLNHPKLEPEVIEHLKSLLRKKAMKELVDSNDIQNDYFNLFDFLRKEVNQLNEEMKQK